MKKILLVEVPDTYDETYMNLDVRFYDPVLGDLDNDGEVICEFTELTIPTEAERREKMKELYLSSATCGILFEKYDEWLKSKLT